MSLVTIQRSTSPTDVAYKNLTSYFNKIVLKYLLKFNFDNIYEFTQLLFSLLEMPQMV